MPSEKSNEAASIATFFFMSPPRDWMTSKLEAIPFLLANTLPRPGIPPGFLLWRDADPRHGVAGDGLGDEARGLDVLREFAQIVGGGGPSLRRADRLLHRGETAIEHARAGKRLGVGHEPRLQSREHFQFVFHE